MAAGVAAGVVLGAYSQYKQAEADADTATNQAAAQREEASELIKRSLINAKSTKREGEDVQSGQLSSYIASGVEIGEGTPLSVIEDTVDKVSRQVALDMEAAEFDAEQLRRNATYLESSASSSKTNATIGAIGTLVMGGARAYSM